MPSHLDVDTAPRIATIGAVYDITCRKMSYAIFRLWCVCFYPRTVMYVFRFVYRALSVWAQFQYKDRFSRCRTYIIKIRWSWDRLVFIIGLHIETTLWWVDGVDGSTMMTSSNGSIFRVTGPLCGEFTGHWWIPLTKASDAELRCFLWSAPWINGWVNNHQAGDLRCHRAYYDVIVIQQPRFSPGSSSRFPLFIYQYMTTCGK